MLHRRIVYGLEALALVGFLGTCASAAASVNVALRASFDAAPYLIELLETAAEENSTAYFPLLDRIADGHFDHAETDRELYELFLDTLRDDGHVTDPDALSSFQLALAIHSTAPRIEAHFQYYKTAVEPLIQGGAAAGPDDALQNCESWVYFDGRQFCSPDLAASSGNVLGNGLTHLPFDRILGHSSTNPASVVYADITSPSFRSFHQTVSMTARSGKTSYRVRYKPSTTLHQHLSVSGYGIELALKRTDYIVIDDRQADDHVSADITTAQATLQDNQVADLRPLPESLLRKLDIKAASFVMNSETPLETLLKLSQDFPKHSAAIAATNASQHFLNEHAANREIFLPPGYNVVWINGVQILPRDFDAFSMLEHLRRERRLINSAKDLGLTSQDAINLLSHPAISAASDDQEPQRYDFRDENEGGHVIMWLNDIEKDKRYNEWPDNIRALLQRTYPGQLPSVRKDIHNLVLPVDFSSFEDVSIVVGNLQNFVSRRVPIRFGLVPAGTSDAAQEQAKVVYHLLDTYGLAAAFDYLEKSLDGQGRKLASPTQKYFDRAIKERKTRNERPTSLLQDVIKSDTYTPRIEAAVKYLLRLGAKGPLPPVFVNGVAIPRSDDWLQSMSTRVTFDSRLVQAAVYQDEVVEDSYLPDLFLARAALRRNPLIAPEDEKDIKFCNLAAVTGLAEGLVGTIPSVHASETTIESELVHLVVVADFDTREGGRLFSEALDFRKDNDNVELFFLHHASSASRNSHFSRMLHEVVTADTTVDLAKLQELSWSELGSETASRNEDTETRRFWNSAASLIQASGIAPGASGILINGRVVGPFTSSTIFDKDDFQTLLAYERKKRLTPAAAAFKELGLVEKTGTPLTFSKLANLVALSSMSDIPEGIFEAAPTKRTTIFEKWKTANTAILSGDEAAATIHIVASIDPASELAQRWIPIIKVLSELNGVYLRLFLNPKDRLEEIPIKRFYRHVLESRPSFGQNGSLTSLQAEFAGLPVDALLTMAMDMPPAWLVSPKDSIHDLDNIKLSSLKGGNIDAVYELEHILIEGHSRDVTLGPPPRGAQLVLGTQSQPHFADTIVMANLGYFQFKANPGFYNLSLQKGRSEEIFRIDSAGILGHVAQSGDETTEIALTSFRGATLFPRLSRRSGKEEEDVLEAPKTAVSEFAEKADSVLSKVGLTGVKTGDYLSKAQKLGSSLFSSSPGTSTDVQVLPHADINIFSVASGHLYERMLNIMMVSVMKHTSHTVKFWFIEQFLSPSFKAFLPALAEEYGFRYEMVTYKWPHWLRAQKEKQREIWGYKILFLDVLFPLDLGKVIFVDADQIIRTDMYELVQYDLQGAPYGFTPMCDSRTEMEGFRFWKQGYWKNFLRGLPYHISALYVVDLVRFRQIAAGDRLRQQYHQLSADPNSLSNLDQDLPNHMQHVLPIHSLPQEWLWCETWCSDASLGVARTIDLCNNPLTKEPKLDRARRQVPEWNIYDEEIAAVARKRAAVGGSTAIVGDGADSGAQAEAQLQDAAAHKKRLLEESRRADSKSDGQHGSAVPEHGEL